MEILVDDVIKCPQCKEVFKSPVNLPCGHSICKHHINEYLINDNDSNKIECLICKKFHQIHESDVLMPNKTIEILLKKNMEKIDLGKEYNSAIDKCNIFGDLLDKFNKIKNDPEMKIYSVISELKNKVDLRREEMKQEIDKEALKMIEKLNEYLEECKMKMKIDSKLDEMLEGWKDSLKRWQLGLNTFDNINRKRILNESTSELKELHSELLKFEESLFLNRLNQFKFPNIFSFNNLHILKFEVKELSKYKDINEKKEFFSPIVNIDGIDFRIQIEIKEFHMRYQYLDKDSTYLGVYLCASQNPFIRDVKIDYDLVIFDQLGLSNSFVFRNSNKILKNDSECWGEPKMVKLKELIDSRCVYNVQNDSCTVQAIVNKVEWI